MRCSAWPVKDEAVLPRSIRSSADARASGVAPRSSAYRSAAASTAARRSTSGPRSVYQPSLQRGSAKRRTRSPVVVLVKDHGREMFPVEAGGRARSSAKRGATVATVQSPSRHTIRMMAAASRPCGATRRRRENFGSIAARVLRSPERSIGRLRGPLTKRAADAHDVRERDARPIGPMVNPSSATQLPCGGLLRRLGERPPLLRRFSRGAA